MVKSDKRDVRAAPGGYGDESLYELARFRFKDRQAPNRTGVILFFRLSLSQVSRLLVRFHVGRFVSQKLQDCPIAITCDPGVENGPRPPSVETLCYLAWYALLCSLPHCGRPNLGSGPSQQQTS